MGTITFLLTLILATILLIGPRPVNHPCTTDEEPCCHLPICFTTAIPTPSTTSGTTLIAYPVTVTPQTPFPITTCPLSSPLEPETSMQTLLDGVV